MPSRDPNGRSLPAFLRFYEPTATFDEPKAVYTTEDLDVAHAFPIASDAAGRFPALWADEDEVFDVTWSDQAFDALIRGWEDLSPLDDAVLASVALAEDAADEAAASAEAAEEAKDEAVDAAAETQAAAGAAISAATIIGTRAQAILIDIPAALESLQTSGYATPGDNGGALYVRVNAEPSHEGKFRSADGGWWEMAEEEANVLAFGAKGDGVADDTQAFLDAREYSRNVVIPMPLASYAVNLVVLTNGGRWRGPGIPKASGPAATDGFLKPFDTSKPVIQIGDDTVAVSGNIFEGGFLLYGANTGVKGLSLQGGAINNRFEDFVVTNFTTNQVELVAGVSQPVAYNKLDRIAAGSFTIGDGVYLDGHLGTYCAANMFSSLNVGVSARSYALRVRACAANYITGVWLQASTDAGILFERTGSEGVTPQIIVDNAAVDSEASGDLLVTCTFSSLADVASMPNLFPYSSISIDGSTFFTQTSTTGGISSGSPTLNVASATGFYAGRTVSVDGAGASGGKLTTTISSVSGTTITLAANASTTASSVAVKVGDVLKSLDLPPPVTLRSDYGFLSEDAKLVRMGGQGSFTPFSTSDLGFLLSGGSLHFMQESGFSPTVSSITRSGTAVTVTSNNGGGARTGDLVIVGGALEAGINGTFTVTAHTSTTLSYTSPVSGTLVAATGALTMRVIRRSYMQAGSLFTANGLYMRDQSGSWTQILGQSLTNGNFTFRTADTSGGVFQLAAGSTASTGAALQVLGGGVTAFQANKYGMIAYGGASSGGSAPGIAHKATTGPSQVPASGEIYEWFDGMGPGGFYFKNNTPTTKRVQDSHHDTTANRPTTGVVVGQQYFDDTLGKPIWAKSLGPIVWVDAAGATA